MAIACVLVTHLPMKLEQLRDGSLLERAALIYEQTGLKKMVLDRSSLAHNTLVGMPLEGALVRCPYADIIEANGPAYREAWEQMLDALESRSPLVEDADLGVAYVDLQGLERLYGDEPRLITALLSALPQAYRPRIGVAESKFTAYIAAMHAAPGSACRAPADAAAFLSGLPIPRLPAAWETKVRLMDFGLKTIGSLAALPFDAMQGEFGKEGARLWHLANDQDRDPLLPRSHKESLAAETAFPTPSASLPAILIALEGLLREAFGNLQGRYVRVAVMEGQVAYRPPWNKRCVFKEPVSEAGAAFRLLRDRLDQLALPGPLETLSLTLTDLSGEVGRQESLFQDVRRQADMDEAIRQLRVRLEGRSPMYRIREMEPWSRIPERRHALVPYEP